MTNRRFGIGPKGSGETTRERVIHAAMCAVGAKNHAVLRATHEPRRWPPDLHRWAGLAGVVVLTTQAREAFSKAVEPRGRRKVWCEVRLPVPYVGRNVDVWTLEWRWKWQEAHEAPKTRHDGILHWLGSEAVRKDRAFVDAALGAARSLLDDAYRAYERARGVEPPEERIRRPKVEKWQAATVKPSRILGVQP